MFPWILCCILLIVVFFLITKIIFNEKVLMKFIQNSRNVFPPTQTL